MRGMDREASRRGYLLLLSTLHAGGEQATNALRAMRGRVDGLIVMAPHLRTEEVSAALPKGLPSILINTRDGSGEHPAIHLDNAAGVRAVVDHLASLGRTKLVHIAGPSENIDAQEREAAFLAAVEGHGLDGRVVAGNFTTESGDVAIRR